MKLSIMKSTVLLSFLSVGMASCLKDKAFDNQEVQSTYNKNGQPKLIEVRLTANSADNFVTKAFESSNKDTAFDVVPIYLSNGEPASEDIKVTVIADPTAVEKYNKLNNDTLHPASTSMFSIVNQGGIVTIPKGSTTGFVKIKLKSADYAAGGIAIGIKVTAVDKAGYSISGNLNTAVIGVVVKNEWDGIYTAVGHFFHPTSPRDIDEEAEELATVGANMISKPLADLSPADYQILLTINPDNTVKVTGGKGTENLAGPVANDAVSGAQYAQYNNTYDPATKTFWLCYSYPGNGGLRTTIEKVTFVKKRD